MSRQITIEKSMTINASPEKIYGILIRLENWHSWTPSVKSISFLNQDDLKVGSKIKILQPKLLPAVWTITEVVENHLLVWEKKSPGLKMTAFHSIENSNNNSKVTLRMTYQGVLAKLVYKLTASLTNQYMTMEIDGLKKESESN